MDCLLVYVLDIANELTKALSTVERLENEKNHKLISEDASSSVQKYVIKFLISF